MGSMTHNYILLAVYLQSELIKMTKNVDDIHSYDSGYMRAIERFEALDTSEHNQKIVKGFIMSCRREEIAKSTRTNYINLLKRMVERLKDIDCHKDLDELDQDDFDQLLMYLEDIRHLSPGEIRNYKKVTKKFYKSLYEDSDDIPKWVKNLKLGNVDSPVQPSDLLTTDDMDKLMAACRHPRDKALITVLADGGMRIGALASCRIKNVEFNQYGAIIYISKTSKSRKTAKPKGIPITWSTGYLNQWLNVHPLKDDPEAPLWVTLNKNQEPMSYNSARTTILSIAKRAGVKKRVNPHSFRHKAITTWILDGLNEQEVKHRAAWSRGSMQMLKIYANFTDQEINDNIFEHYGLKSEGNRTVTLDRCPRCDNVLHQSDKYCGRCRLIIDSRMVREVNEMGTRIPDAMQLLIQDPETQKLIAESLSGLIQNDAITE